MRLAAAVERPAQVHRGRPCATRAARPPARRPCRSRARAGARRRRRRRSPGRRAPPATRSPRRPARPPCSAATAPRAGSARWSSSRSASPSKRSGVTSPCTCRHASRSARRCGRGPPAARLAATPRFGDAPLGHASSEAPRAVQPPRHQPGPPPRRGPAAVVRHPHARRPADRAPAPHPGQPLPRRGRPLGRLADLRRGRPVGPQRARGRVVRGRDARPAHAARPGRRSCATRSEGSCPRPCGPSSASSGSAASWSSTRSRRAGDRRSAAARSRREPAGTGPRGSLGSEG